MKCNEVFECTLSISLKVTTCSDPLERLAWGYGGGVEYKVALTPLAANIWVRIAKSDILKQHDLSIVALSISFHFDAL